MDEMSLMCTERLRCVSYSVIFQVNEDDAQRNTEHSSVPAGVLGTIRCMHRCSRLCFPLHHHLLMYCW